MSSDKRKNRMTQHLRPEIGYAAVAGGELFYERSGDGSAVVLVHAGICDLRMWGLSSSLCKRSPFPYQLSGKRPSKRMASWLRMQAQLCGGMVHLRVISRVTRNSSLRAASPVGNAPLVFTTLRNCRL